MDIHEYQAKEILQSYGVPVPPFAVAASADEASLLAEKMKLAQAVLKIQVHAGGRGKGGGVRFAKSKEEIALQAKQLIGMKFINNQTGPAGVIAEKVLLGPPIAIDKEYYLAAVIDRKKGMPIVIASAEGGMDIEELSIKHPEKILAIPIELSGIIRPFHLIRLAKFMQWSCDLAKEGTLIAKALAKAFIEMDASLIEINPLVASQGKLWALDAKFSVDENALYRQPKIASFYDPGQKTQSEREAKEFDLSYVAMEGNIGCMVNGAGLAMATMDIIQLHGGRPANFLDVGGGASKEKVAFGCKIILHDPRVQVILVNIFGGIMDCAVLAEGVVSAIREFSIQVPLVVRMEGTNVEKGKAILKEANLAIISADSLSEAAEKAVGCTKKK
jgi:succinyl-CoA synthetase beta subunit